MAQGFKSSANIVVTAKAEANKLVELCWQAKNEQEAKRLVQFLKDNGVEAKAVAIDYCKDFK